MSFGEKRPSTRQRVFPGRLATLMFLAMMFLAMVQSTRGQDDPRSLLHNASEKVLETVERLPRYVCTETVARYRYEPVLQDSRPKTHLRSCDDIAAEMRGAAWKQRQRLTSADRLRLDVAVGRGEGADGEMYSWAGADRFSGRDLFEMVADGALSTGNFSSMLASIFRGRAARFTYDGDTTVGQRLFSEFGFQVPQEMSSYLYLFGKGRGQQAAVGYEGTVLVDPDASDVVRLVVRTSSLPAESGACELIRTVNYGRARLHDAEFLLPKEARVSLVHADETVAENVITYSDCREFQGQSTVQFEPLANGKPVEPDQNAPSPSFELPPGLPFTLAFTDPIDPAMAAAGDLVQGKLKTAIRDRSKKKILLPEGTPVLGRIVKIRRYYEKPVADGRKSKAQQPSLVLAVKLESLEINGQSFPLRASFDAGLQRFVKQSGPLSVRVDIGTLDQSQDSGTAVFEIWDTNPDAVVQSGLESNWLTLGPRS